jgi:LmbE family N-acetylglucosaminyl deacetylase
MSGGGLHPDDASVLRLLDPSTNGEFPRDRPPRILGAFAHPDDGVFYVGGTLARCAADGAGTAVLSPGERKRSAGRGADARLGPIGAGPDATGRARPSGPMPTVEVDVRPALHCKVAALAAHRSPYAMAPDTFPHAVHERLLGTEYFVVADPADAARMETPR